MENIKDKIAKLLRLAGSENDAESKAALLKAHELMAKHKLSEKECVDVEKQGIEKRLTGVTFTQMTNSWIGMLSTVIADNYCCCPYLSSYYHGRTYEVGFIGFEEDAEVCSAVFAYAVDCAMSKINEIKHKLSGLSGKEIRRVCNQYGQGFYLGVVKMYDKQNAQNEEWGLVLVTPKEVEDETKQTCTEKDVSIYGQEQETSAEQIAKEEGYKDGREFAPEHRIETNTDTGKGNNNE